MASDSSYDEILKLLQSLQVDTIHRDWTRRIWDEDFQISSIQNLSIPYEGFSVDAGLTTILHKLTLSLKKETQSNRRTSAASTLAVNFSEMESSRQSDSSVVPSDLFKVLPTVQIEMRRLLAFLGYLFEKGRENSEDASFVKTSTLAISVYYLLLSMKGSSGYLVFVDSLFTQSLSVLKTLVQQDVDGISAVVLHMQDMLSSFKLKGRREVVQSLVEFMIETASLEPTKPSITEENLHVYSSNPFIVCYQNLKLLLSDIHGSPQETLKEIMCYLLPIILGSGKNSKISENIRTRSVSFLVLISDLLGPPGKKTVVGFIQQVCLNVEDKVDSRKRAIDTVFVLLRAIPSDLLLKILKWLMLMTFHNSVSLRTYALEVITKIGTDCSMVEFLLAAFKEEVTFFMTERSRTPPPPAANKESEDTQDGNEPENQEDVRTATFHESVDLCSFILGTVFAHLWDTVPSVRAKAIGCIVSCLECDVPQMKNILGQFFRKFTGRLPTNNILREPVDIQKAFDDSAEPCNYLPNVGDFLFILFASLTEKTVKERKQAVELLFKIIMTEDCFLTAEFVKIASQNCRDPSVVIRQTALALVTDLMVAKPCDVTRNVWIQNVLPATEDREEKIVKMVFESMENVLLRQLLGENESLALELLSQINAYGYRQQLQKVCSSWSKEQKVKPGLISVLQRHLEGEYKLSAWFFMSIVCRFVPVKSGDFAADAFQQLLSNDKSEGIDVQILQLVLQTLVAISMQLSPQKIEALHSQILDLLTSFHLPAELVPVARDVLVATSRRIQPSRWEEFVTEWATDIVKACDVYLSEKILKNSPDRENLDKEFEDAVMRRLVTLGDLAQLCPGRVSSRACVVVQSVVFPFQVITAPKLKEAKGSTRNADIPAAEKRNLDKNAEPISASQPLPSSQIPSSQPISCSFRHSPLLQSAGLVTLGKLCLQNEKLAKQVVPALGKLLASSTESSLKNNIVHVLCDIIIRYASLADPLMPHVLLCLKDDHIRVRRNTLSLLIGLLQEDYLKLRENFFYRIVQMIIDEDSKMREMAIYYITQRLLPRKPKILSQHFIESVFHFNDYQDHASFNKFQQSQEERILFSVAGEHRTSDRFRIYAFMLENMSDEERFSVLYNLCRDILKPVHEGIMPLPNAKTEALLQDALKLIASKEIKLNMVKGGKPADEDHDGDEAAQAVIEGVRKAVITHLVKKNYIENIVPTLVKLKHELEKKRSPLLGDLMNCLKEIVKDYKNEVSEIFAADRQLATEVEYDLKKWEEACKNKEEQERLAAVARQRRRSERRTNNANQSLNITVGEEPAGENATRAVDTEAETAADPAAVLELAVETAEERTKNGRKRVRAREAVPEEMAGRLTPPASEAEDAVQVLSTAVKARGRKKMSMLVSTPLPNIDEDSPFLNRTQDISVIGTAEGSEAHLFKTPGPPSNKMSGDGSKSVVRRSTRGKEEVQKTSTASSDDSLNQLKGRPTRSKRK